MKTTKRIREIAQSISILADNLEYWISQLYDLADDADERGEDDDREREDSADPRAVRARDTTDAAADWTDDDEDADSARNAVGHLAMLLGVSHATARDERAKE